MATIQSKPVPNLIQGVSQQTSQQRRDSQCEAQMDCINSPKDGAVARPGGLVGGYFPGANYRDVAPYELIRGREEHYLILVKDEADGPPQVFDLNTGGQGTVTLFGSAAAYLNTAGAPAEDSFCFQTVDDYTFVANKTIRPQMGPQRSLTRPREALVFFKAGGYLSTYAISIRWGGITYRWLYSTPDNSSPNNAAYIATNYLAAIFYRAMTKTAAGGAGADGSVGAVYDGTPTLGNATQDNSTGGTVNPSVQSLGFSMAINGNILRIWRNDGQNFTLDTTDSVGDTYLTSFKDTVRSFSDLPRNGFEGFTLQVKAKVTADEASDYWVEYVTNIASTGYWQERAAPGVPTTLDPSTMPHAFINVAPGVFELRPQVWSTRIAGDGEDSAKDPGFVNKNIEDLFYHKGRLAILTESTVDFSKARNVFTHFPDTVQTLLATAPIGIQLSASDTIALLRRNAKVDESLYLWAQGAQFRITSNNDPFKQDTVEANDSTAYEFAERSNFARVGATLYFATEPTAYATLRNLTFSQGRAVGDTDVTAHVSEYIPAGVRRLSPSDTGQMMFVRTDGDPAALFLYNYLVQDRTVVQSGWNKWRLPVEKVVWASVFRLTLYALVQLPSGAAIVAFPLSPREEDYPGAGYLTRLDLREAQSSCVVSYRADDDTTLIQPSIPVIAAAREFYRVVSSVSVGSRPRGRDATVLAAEAGGLRVAGDWRNTSFYLGRRIESYRQESTFYLRTDTGVVPTDRITLHDFTLRYAITGYSRIEVDIGAGRPVKKYETRHVPLGYQTNALGAPPGVQAGTLVANIEAPHEEATVRLVNDSWLPSRWQTADWRYTAVLRAKVGAAGSGGAG